MKVGRLGKSLQDEQLLDIASLDALHIASFVNIQNAVFTGRLVRSDRRGDDLLSWSLDYGPGLVAIKAGDRLWQGINDLDLALSVHDNDLICEGDKEAILREGPGVFENGLCIYGHSRLGRIGSEFIGQDSHRPVMVHPSVARAEYRNDLIAAGDRFCVDHNDAGVHIAVEDILSGPIGTHHPQVVVVDLAAIDVFPSRVENTPIRQHPGRIVMLDITRKLRDIAAFSVATVHYRDLRLVAGNPAVAPRRDKENAPIGHICRLEIVIIAGCYLSQVLPVGIDLVKIVKIAPSHAIRKQYLFAVIMDLRVADRTAFGIQQERAFLRSQVVLVQLTPAGLSVAGIGGHILVFAVVPDIGIPVAIIVRLAGGKDDLLDTAHRAGKSLL